MHPTTLLLLSLVAFASAIDVLLHVGRHCTGIAHVYERTGGNACIATFSPNFGSVKFTWIPRDWNIQGRIYRLKGCDSGSQYGGDRQSNGRTELCANPAANSDKIVRSASWYRHPDQKVRRGEADIEVGEMEVKREEECVRPSFLQLEDGTRFSVVGMADDILDLMVSYIPSIGCFRHLARKLTCLIS